MKLEIKKSGKRAVNNSKAGLQERTQKQVSLRKTMFILAMLAIPLLLLPPLITHWEAEKGLQSSQEQNLDLSIQIYTNGVQRWVSDQTNKAEVLAGDPLVIGAFLSEDPDTLTKRGKSLKSYFPDALKVRLIKPGMHHEEMSASPPITFAGIEMIQVAQSSTKPVPMEVHGAGTSQLHVNLARPVLGTDGRTIVGVLMISFSMNKLQQLVTGVNIPGYTELNQTSGASSMLLSQQGDTGFKTSTSDRSEVIEGSQWTINYWKQPAQLAGSKSLIYGLASAVAAILLLLTSAFIQRGKLTRAFVKDQETIRNVFEDMKGSRVKSEYPVVLVEMRDGMDLIAEAAQMTVASMPRTTKSINTSQPAPAAMEVVDVVEGNPLFDEQPESDNSLDMTPTIDSSIFRAYDIRGIYGETLTEDSAFLIGQAIGSEAYLRGEQTVIVGRDGRLSGEALSEALVKGLLASGRDVKDIGQVPTPVLYFAATTRGNGTGVMVTGSHNPANYNGFKVMMAGECLTADAIKSLHQRIVTNDFLVGSGTNDSVDVLPEYTERIQSDIQITRPVKIVVDCGNGVAGAVAPELFKALGCDVTTLFCDVDGTFPNHHPDPGNPENLAALITCVREEGAELGIAFDGDGDRIGVVTADGAVVWPDRLMMLFATDVLLRNPGAQIIYDVKSTRHLATVIAENGGEPLMWQTGHSVIKSKMQQTGALLAGEMSGHIFFKERWFGFDDALYAAARLLEILAGDPRSVSDIFASLPDSVNTPELTIPMAEGEPSVFMTQLSDSAVFHNASIGKLDGMRVETERGWGLVRASNTTPSLVLRFEADDELAMHTIQEAFRREMLQVKPDLVLPF